MLCDLCRSIDQDVRNPKIHERLRQVDSTERIARPGKRKAVWVTCFQCDTCGTRWRHVDDHANKQAGWSIEQDSS